MKQTQYSTNHMPHLETAVKYGSLRAWQKAQEIKPPLFARIGLKRTGWRDLTLARLLKGGRLSDGGRFGRYALIVTAGLAVAWGPAITYLKYGKVSYTTHFSLILPGAGASTSINLSEIGQASSVSSSAFSGSTISPTVTYKNLLMSANVAYAAAAKLKIDAKDLPAPTIKLVDETSFITVEVNGASASDARDHANAIQEAFFAELNKLRQDETRRRDASTIDTVKQYEKVVNDVGDRISALKIQSGLSSAEQFNGLVAAADALQIRIADAEAEYAKVKLSRQSLSHNLNLDDHLAATTMKLHADPEFAALAEATSKAEAELAAAAQQFGAKHPKVVEARAQFNGARSQMLRRASKITGLSAKKFAGKIDFSPTGQRSALMSQLVGLATDQNGLEGQLQAMKNELAASRQKISSLVGTAANLDRLNSEHKVAEAVFASALARISTSKTDIFASYPMVQVSEAAVMPLTPSSPNKKIAIAAAASSTFLLLFASLLAWIRRPLIDKLLNMAQKPDDQSKPA